MFAADRHFLYRGNFQNITSCVNANVGCKIENATLDLHNMVESLYVKVT